MLLEGSIVDGAIVLDEPSDLPDGTRVRIEAVMVTERKPIASLESLKELLKRERGNSSAPGPTLAVRLKDFIAHEVELPNDTASRVDHYLEHGLPPIQVG